ncbi:MAG: DUF2252 domain-containing protein [Reyranella sp.]|nr:DUF2252 domain-containing protein [Reyranella sp.]MBL6650189.1 DUF2252 domain-containing protein [Reyranella sp.]
MVEHSPGALPPQTHIRPIKERVQHGRALREHLPRRHHAAWKAPANRRDPIDILIEQGKSRLPDLLPERYARMKATPFTFLRGAAAVMAADLAGTQSSGLLVQAAGDCHCLNFGGFATPERRLVFDINDFDETAVAPWEWDVKRLAASFAVATLGQLDKPARAELAGIVARSYRRTMASVAGLTVLDAWYLGLELDRRVAAEQVGIDERAMRKAQNARTHPIEIAPVTHRRSGGVHRIEDDPEHGVFHPPRAELAAFEGRLRAMLVDYAASLTPSRRTLLARYRFADAAYKVVGVGAVGTLCGVILMVSGDGEALHLQFKEATHSVLEAFTAPSPYAHHGERVVRGQRLLQAASDILLGFATGPTGRHLYVRQLRDAKVSPRVEGMSARNWRRYAETCGEVLARAHARTADAVVMSAYLGSSEAFDEAIGTFAVGYARQTEKDHSALLKALKSGRLPSRKAGSPSPFGVEKPAKAS